MNDLSSDSPVKVEPFDDNNTGSSEGNDDGGSNEVDDVTGGVAGQVSSNDGITMQGMQAIQLPATNGQSQPATVVQFNGQVNVKPNRYKNFLVYSYKFILIQVLY